MAEIYYSENNETDSEKYRIVKKYTDAGFGRRRSNFGKRKVTNSRISLKIIEKLIKLVQKI
jgi:hypothetical protein